MELGVVPRAAAIEFAEGGVAPTIELVAAGGAVAAANDCGTDCVEGRAGALDFATSEALSGDASCFQNAHRGADWQPTSAKIATTTNPNWFVRELISRLPSRMANFSLGESSCRHGRRRKGTVRNRMEKSVVSKSSAKPVGPIHRFNRVACTALHFLLRRIALAARSRTDARPDYSGAARPVNVSRWVEYTAINGVLAASPELATSLRGLAAAADGVSIRESVPSNRGQKPISPMFVRACPRAEFAVERQTAAGCRRTIRQ
jgi:hypothetical protein